MDIQRETGFSLLEVVIAMAIFTTGMLAVAGLQITSVRGNVVAREATVTTALGQAEIERLLALPFEHPDLSATGAGSRNWEEAHYLYRLVVVEDELLQKTKTIQLDVDCLLQGKTKGTRLVAAKANLF